MIRKHSMIWTVFALSAHSVLAQNITLTQVTTPFNSLVGIDHDESNNWVIVSVNYLTGGYPHNFERIRNDGTHVPFSIQSGMGDEVKIATIKSGGPGGFKAGDLFAGNGFDGQIMRITDSGVTIQDPWFSLPAGTHGLMRGSLYHDRTGVFGGDLIAVTTLGEVWRVTSGATSSATPLASLGTHLEGVVTVPDNVAQYGPIAGMIIAGAEQQGGLYAIDPAGNARFIVVGVEVEDIDHIQADMNFYGVNFGSSQILGAPATEFASMVGDILLTQEVLNGSTSGLYRLHWDGSNLTATELGLTAGSEIPTQWEHVTFSTATLPPITSSSPMVQNCLPGQGGVRPCPCDINLFQGGVQPNQPTAAGLGCGRWGQPGIPPESGAGTGKSGTLDAVGSVIGSGSGTDTVKLLATGLNATALTVFYAGRPPKDPIGIISGAGVRCVTASLKRLYTHSAVAGAVSVPQGTDMTLSARTATQYGIVQALLPSQTFKYFCIYRDAQAAHTGAVHAGGSSAYHCPGMALATFNVTNAGSITW